MRFGCSLMCLALLSALSLETLLPYSATSAELEDFAGGVSNTRVTINPATTALIDRFHFQYNTRYLQGVASSTRAYTDYLTYQGQDGEFVVGPDTPVNGVEYDDGLIASFETTVVIPFADVSFCVAQSFNHESYEDGKFLDADENLIPSQVAQTDSEQETNSSISSIVFGIAFESFSLGVRWNRKQIKDEITGFDPIAVRDTSNLEARTVLNDFLQIEANSSFSYYDFGILIPEVFSGFDLGLMVRPRTKAEMKFKSLAESTTEIEDFDYSEPSLTVFGFGYVAELTDGVGVQLLGDVGGFGKVDTNRLGEASKSGGVSGGLLRFIWYPWIDISAGTRTQTYLDLTYVETTTSVQFPFFEGSNTKLSWTHVEVRDAEDEVLFDASYPNLSFNLQFGERRGRALEVKPKTKKLTFIDRL